MAISRFPLGAIVTTPELQGLNGGRFQLIEYDRGAYIIKHLQSLTSYRVPPSRVVAYKPKVTLADQKMLKGMGIAI